MRRCRRNFGFVQIENRLMLKWRVNLVSMHTTCPTILRFARLSGIPAPSPLMQTFLKFTDKKERQNEPAALTVPGASYASQSISTTDTMRNARMMPSGPAETYSPGLKTCLSSLKPFSSSASLFGS